ncbi:MAG: polynucleotide kinase-phosphatase [Candidatus Sumerlaeaceae bacterium]|nr:polynucleotide kinase-phosphatase [Candidatus Sumerlaeaceae bacterium]
MNIKIPELALVVLIGPSGSGKSTFAATHFQRFEVISSDFCRGLVSNDENSQEATPDAFDVLNFIAAKRLAAGKLTVVDATNVQPEARKPLVELARTYHCLPVAIVFNLPERLCQDRNVARSDRNFGPHVISQQRRNLRQNLRKLDREGFRHVFIFEKPEQVDAATIQRDPLWNNRKSDHGPFDIIGDVHGCLEELVSLLGELGYAVTEKPDNAGYDVVPPEGRKAVFVGDLVDRGPFVPGVLKLVMDMVEAGTALCVPGNHDVKLMRKLRGKNVQITHGLAESLEQLDRETPEFRSRVANFLDDLVSHYVLDEGRLVVAHAGLKQEMQGRGSGRVREFALYGETTGETDEFGLPVRYNWAADYRGSAVVVYGHTPVPEPEWLNNTINIDTGCVFGGALSALRYPEKEIVSVPAVRMYAEPKKPLVYNQATAERPAQQQQDDVLFIEDVIGKRIIETRLHRTVTIREENAVAALEAMSRFAINPKWLIHLPPTMSPSETTTQPGYLEYPTEAFAYFRTQGVGRVVCQEKHMGSRAIVVACRDNESARKRFGILDDAVGACYTRTGRRFFNDPKLETDFFEGLCAALTESGFWDRFQTDWVCLDCELMPWSAKAQELIRTQYAAVGSAAQMGLSGAAAAIEVAASRNLPEGDASWEAFRSSIDSRFVEAAQFTQAYQRYAWPVESLSDYKLAPFHVLATEGRVHMDKDHIWHMETISQFCDADKSAGPLLLKTPWRVVDVTNPDEEQSATSWWEELTNQGGEGMVVKPLGFVERARRGLVQPALKCRGREYLRIIYGPHYTEPQNLERLRRRAIHSKRSLALREFALGAEALERFIRREPLRRVHECVFGVLALESEPVDPRL